MSRAASLHIARLEDAISRADAELTKVVAHAPVMEAGNPNCQCGHCRAVRVLTSAPKRSRRKYP